MTMSDPIADMLTKNPQRKHCKARHRRRPFIQDETELSLISL